MLQSYWLLQAVLFVLSGCFRSNLSIHIIRKPVYYYYYYYYYYYIISGPARALALSQRNQEKEKSSQHI